MKKKNYIQKNQIKKKPTKKAIADDDDWICADCGEVWDDDGDCRWIT